MLSSYPQQENVMERRFIAIQAEDFLAAAEAHLEDHIKAGRGLAKRRRRELMQVGVLVRRKPAAMTAKKKR
jgi:hypothetical protein